MFLKIKKAPDVICIGSFLIVYLLRSRYNY